MKYFSEYLTKYGDLLMSDKPFNEVDGLILCQLSYLTYDGILTNFLDKHQEDDLAHICANTWNPAMNQELLTKINTAARFNSLKILDTKEVVSLEEVGQFFAMTLEIYPGLNCIVFRGTDTSFTGWAESLSLSFEPSVPSQDQAQKYLVEAMNKFEGKFIVCGHSKGGNLAVYSVSTLPTKYHSRLIRVYNMDGPGFLEEFYESYPFDLIKHKIHKFIPSQAIVGLLLISKETVKIVDCEGILFEAHDPFKWKIEEDHFVYAKQTKVLSQYTDHTINRWLQTIDRHDRQEVIENLFKLLQHTGNDNLKDIADNWFKSLPAIIKSINEINSDVLKHAIGEFIKSSGKEIVGMISSKIGRDVHEESETTK